MARRQQVTFTDPAAVLPPYVWQLNPGPDAITQPAGKQISIDRVALSSNIGPVRQEGDDGAYIIHWEPLIFHEAQEIALWKWRELSKTRSIYMTDFNGEQFEGQIITLQRQQIGALAGPGDTDLRGFYCKYVFEFEVWTVLSGPLATAGVTV